MSSLSVNSINSYLQSSAQNSYQQNQQQNFLALSNALQSGNLSAAQTAFSALQQQYQNQNSSNPTSSSSSSSQQPSTSSVIGTDLQNLSSALQSGNLNGAQQAFGQLQHDLQTQGGQGHHHHHHHGGGSGDAQQPTSTTSAAGSAQTGTIDVEA